MKSRKSLCLAVLVMACTSSDQGSPSKRVTILERPGTYGYTVAKDGRLTYGKFVDGKSAIYVADADGGHPKRVSFGVWDTGPLWSPDGKWIVFLRDAGGSNEVVIVPADSGAERAVGSSPADERASGWLPNSDLVFNRTNDRGSQIWVYSMADGSTKRLMDTDGSVTYAVPSHDGKHIAYNLAKDGKNTIWVSELAAGSKRQLTTDGLETLNFYSWSPDDRTIAYATRRSGTQDVWRVDVASGERKQLTTDVGDDFNPRWSPDGTRIGFYSNRGGQSDIWVMTKGEEDVQRVTDDPTFEDSAYEWAPDGKSIIVAVTPDFGHFYRLPIDGGPAEQVTNDDIGIGNASLSRDGTQVVYESIKNGDADVWMRPATGGEAHLVSGAPGFDGQPDFSPDGSQVVFTSNRSGNSDLWIAPATGGAARRLTDWPSSEFTARWSPDGKSIAFLSDKNGASISLSVVPVAGGTPRQIRTSANVGADYRWSADSRSIAYAAQDAKSSVRRIFTVAVAGGTERQITTKASFAPEWSHSGRELATAECDSGYCGMVVHSADGKPLRSLTAKGPLYEQGLYWSHNDSLVAVSYQDLVVGGAFKTDVRNAQGGDSRHPGLPDGFGATPLGFLAGDKAVLAVAGPNGTVLQRIPIPAPIKTP